MVKKLLVILLTSVFSVTYSQVEENEAQGISLSIVLPDNFENLSMRSLSKIESKIQHIVSRNGISGRGYSNEFLIYPKFEIFDETVVEGMKNITVIEVELSLFIQQYSTKKVYSSYSKSLKGSGYSKEKSIINAISKISSNDKELKEFLLEGKRKILDYYENNCDQIVADAEADIKMQNYAGAIAKLYSVPKEVKSCYSAVQAKTVEAYLAYQNQLCEKTLLKAKTEIAQKRYSSALGYLSWVDPSSNCISECEEMITDISEELDEKEKREIQERKKRNQDKMKMEKHRINAVRDIAIAYYKSKPTTVIYRSLF